MKNGATVAAFEREFAARVGAKYAIACANGTVTIQGALAALNVRPGDRVAVPPLTMAATSIAVLNVGAVPVFCDVDERTWVMDAPIIGLHVIPNAVSVSLHGLHCPFQPFVSVDDAAQTLRKHDVTVHFTSYSFQASKILTTGEGGMLVTNDQDLAAGARSYLSLGYRMGADQARIDPASIKAPTAVRHYLTHAINGRMNDLTAREGLVQLEMADALLDLRYEAASYYADVVPGVPWITPQYVPDGWTHDYWTYAVACDTPDRARRLADAVVRHGGERPYAAWRLTYQEPAFRHLAQSCPIAESLQPRLLQFQTNTLEAASANADALRMAVLDCDDV